MSVRCAVLAVLVAGCGAVPSGDDAGSTGGGTAGGQGSSGGGAQGGGSGGGTAGGDAGGDAGGSAGGLGGGAGGGGGGGDDAGTTAVTFSYRPSWSGVTAVEVVGGFGQASDWTTPLASLTDVGGGTYSATVQLAAGAYPYL